MKRVIARDRAILFFSKKKSKKYSFQKSKILAVIPFVEFPSCFKEFFFIFDFFEASFICLFKPSIYENEKHDKRNPRRTHHR